MGALVAQAILRAADETVDWLGERKYSNLLLDVCNECDLCRVTKLCDDDRRAMHLINWPGGGYFRGADFGEDFDTVALAKKAKEALNTGTPHSRSR